jgi:hypothetical protein
MAYACQPSYLGSTNRRVMVQASPDINQIYISKKNFFMKKGKFKSRYSSEKILTEVSQLYFQQSMAI